MSEKLSNLLDRHVAESDLDDFLHECRKDSSLIDMWQRYHQAGALIRNEINESDFKFDVSAKVMAGLQSQFTDTHDLPDDNSNVVSLKPAIENRPTPTPSKSAQQATRMWVPVALAASVLLGMYFIFQQPLLDNPTQQVAENASTTSQSPLPDHAYEWQVSSREVENVLNSLLVEHSEFTSVTGMNGLGSYSKFIAYQN